MALICQEVQHDCPQLRVSVGFCRANPYSKHLHSWSQHKVWTLGHLFYDRAGGTGSSPDWVQKTLGFGLSCAPDEKNNRDINRESVVPSV